MTMPLTGLPPYRVRESRRARRARIQVTPMGDVEVVVPQGFNISLVPAFLGSHQDWLEKILARTRALRPAELDNPIPASVTLAAIGLECEVFYRQGERNRVKLTANDTLDVFLSPEAELHKVLQRWLTRTARKHLACVIDDVASYAGLEFGKLSVRGQRSRWGSCSCRKDISLNRSLMFLAPELVRYVVLHELCHTQHMNHSKCYWQLVARHEPDYKLLDRQLRSGWHHVPRWALTTTTT
ncbi:MAG: M48 family metallopeptidase [Proteobacteria bacterium]|nr:M48 family metallopeptidase [Pseudomonadota bacterium]